MIDDYSWPRSAAGAAGERTDRSQRKRDPGLQAGDVQKSPAQPQSGDTSTQQQGDGSTVTDHQQQQSDGAAVKGTKQQGIIYRDWAAI